MNDPTITLPLARLAADPEIKQSKNGTTYMRLRVAANGSHYDKSQKQWVNHETFYADITEFDERMIATYQQTLHKGTPVRVEGTLEWNPATNNNGQPVCYFSVRFAHITLVLQKAKQQQTQQPPQPPTDPFAGGDAWANNDFDTNEKW